VPSAAKTPDRFCHAHPRRVFCTAGLDPGRNRMFRALRSPQQKPRSPGLRRTKNAVGRYLFRKKRLPHRVDLADWRFEARLAHYRRLQIGAARPLVVFWQTRPAPVPIVGAISAHKPQGAGPLAGDCLRLCCLSSINFSHRSQGLTKRENCYLHELFHILLLTWDNAIDHGLLSHSYPRGGASSWELRWTASP
jgi:hypothetical protein